MSPNLDRLKEDFGSPIVYDLVPAPEKENFRYWRAISLSRLALTLQSGISLLNALMPDDRPVHFSDHQLYVNLTALGIAYGTMPRQVEKRYKEIGRMLGMEFAYGTESPVLIIARNLQEPQFSPPCPSRHLGAGGVVMHTLFTDVDPYSQEFIKDYFDLGQFKYCLQNHSTS